MSITFPSAAALALSASLLVSCGGGSSDTTITQTMAKNAGDAQTSTINSTLAVRPSVKITDQSGAAVASVTVTFAVASGGGFITGATTTTGSDGIATVGSWTLGASAGANTLTATAANTNGSPQTFTATATAAAPKTLTKQTGDGQTAAAGSPVAIAPSVKVVDVSGTPLSGIPIVFTVTGGGGFLNNGGTSTVTNTNSSGIAALVQWQLGPTAGANTLSATTGASGVTGDPAVFTATGTLPSFSPTTNVAISGNLAYSSINIPAGVTVVLSADATITVSGAVTIAGTLTGDCVNLTMTITGAFTSTGNISNGCSTAPSTPPAVTIVAQGGYHVTAGTYVMGGSLNLTNSALLPASLNGSPANSSLTGSTPAGRNGSASLHAGTCFAGGVTITVSPANAKAGTNGQIGTNGADAGTLKLSCEGEMDITGGLVIIGQNGGAGGNGTHVSAVAALATGGNGGKGGAVKLLANDGDLVFTGAGNNLQSGNGGAGGTATATGTLVGNPGTSATATGGNGGAPGLVSGQSVQGGVTITGALTLTIGSGGNGGFGTATAANGQDAVPCPAGLGGAAAGTGGVGGSTPDKTLTATGAVTGLGNVTVVGGNPGTGGAATSTSGNGGAGAQTCKPGGNGGGVSALGGQGGDALLKNAQGALIANGGNGGLATWVAAHGGQGWNDCVAPFESGGNGGAGGTASQGDGAGGAGLAQGLGGSGVYQTVSDGGNGGNGMGPGAGGLKGGNNTTLHRAGTTIAPSFVDGTPGNWCPISKQIVFSIANPATDDPSNHESVLQLIATNNHTVGITNDGRLTNVIQGNAVVFTLTYNPSTGIIGATAPQFVLQARTITSAVFTGTWNVATQQLIGDLVLTILGQGNTVKYHVVDP